MVESKEKLKNYGQIQYANVYQSLHIGCQRYGGIDPNYEDVKESYKDVEEYKKFFNEILKFDKVEEFTDKSDANLNEARKKIKDKL